MKVEDSFVEFVRFLYGIEFNSYDHTYKIEVLEADKETDNSEDIYNIHMKLYESGEVIFDDELQFRIPVTIGDVVDTGNATRVSITLGLLRTVLRTNLYSISGENFYINIGNNKKFSVKHVTDDGQEVYLDFYSVLKYLNLLDKYKMKFNAPDSVPDLTDNEISLLNKVTLDNRELTKIKLFYRKSEISNRLDSNTVDNLIGLIGDEEFMELRTPLDFNYVDLTSGMVHDIRSKQVPEIRRTIKAKVGKYKKVFATELQTPIRKYFNLQASFYRTLQSPADDNALSIQSQSRTIYFEAPVKDPNGFTEGIEKLRMYNDYFIGVLDPIMTTEAAAINQTNRLSNATTVTSDGELKVKVMDLNFNEIMINYDKYITSTILTIDHIDKVNKKIFPNEDGNYVVFKFGEYVEITDPNEIEYLFTVDTMLCPNTEVIPFLNYTDTTRGMMAGKHSAQSIPVVGASPMLVYTDGLKDIYNKSGVNLRSGVEGEVTGIYENEYVKIKTTDGKKVVYHVNEYSKTNNNTNNKYNCMVKVGQNVKPGDDIFTLNSFIDKEWNTAVPAYCAYTTYHAKEHADGIIISESLAKKLGHPMCEVIEVNLSNEFKYSFGGIDINASESKNASHEHREYDLNDYTQFDLIKPGSKVTRLQPLFKYYQYLPDTDDYARILKAILPQDEQLKELMTVRVPFQIEEGTIKSVKVFCNDYLAERPNDYEFIKYYKDEQDKKLAELSEFTGKKQKPEKVEMGDNKYKIVIEIEYINKAKIADKLCNFYGSKGVATDIIPDRLMPVDENGRSIEVILSPLSIAGRKNIGQLFECKLGLVCQEAFGKLESALMESNKIVRDAKLSDLSRILNLMYGTNEYSKYTDDDWNKLYNDNKSLKAFRVKVNAFDHYFTDNIINELLELCGIHNGKRKLYDPMSKTYIDNPITVGTTSIRRLHFIVEDRASSTGRAGLTTVPVLGYGKVNWKGQKIGEQETWQLLSHGKLAELSDIVSENEDKGSKIATGLLALGMKLERVK